MTQRIYKKLFNILANNIKSALLPYPYNIIIEENKHVSKIRVFPRTGIYFTITCTGLVKDACSRSSLMCEFGRSTVGCRPCFVVSVSYYAQTII